ncbi:hypothetical protein U1Q18_013606 [Sarracenia purpurea var. burkii]
MYRSTKEQFFEVVYDWSIHEVNNSRKVWLRLTGVPLHVWCKETFLSLGELWGSVLKVDHRTTNKEWLEFDRVLVLTHQLRVINQTCELKVGKFCYPVFCLEDILDLEDHYWNASLSSHPRGGLQGRGLEGLASNSYVSETLMAEQGLSLQGPPPMLSRDRATYKQALQGNVGELGCEGEELVIDTSHMVVGNLVGLNPPV